MTEITHDHPEGIKGAAATAIAIHFARAGRSAHAIQADISRLFGYDLSAAVDQIRPDYLYNETCQDTVPKALICALEAADFEDAIRNTISIGGDSDTLAAIAGGLAEARFGIPADMALAARNFLPPEMQGVIEKLYDEVN